jgi:hypothetical protein
MTIMDRQPQPAPSLIDLLRSSSEAQLTLAFEELESLLGWSLPASARRYSQWWHNPQHWHVRHWQELGWRASCSLAAELVTFTRTAPAAAPR